MVLIRHGHMLISFSTNEIRRSAKGSKEKEQWIHSLQSVARRSAVDRDGHTVGKKKLERNGFREARRNARGGSGIILFYDEQPTASRNGRLFCRRLKPDCDAKIQRNERFRHFERPNLSMTPFACVFKTFSIEAASSKGC